MPRKKSISIGINEVQAKIDALPEDYLPLDLNLEFHRNKLNALKKLKFILSHTSRRTLQDSEFTHLLVCSLTLVYFFGMRLKLVGSSRFQNFFEKRNFTKAEVCFQKTMNHLQPERSDMTIKITLNFFDDVALWPFESFCTQILDVLLFFNRGKMTLFNVMLTDIHSVLFSDVKAARHRMRVLYELLKSENWVIDKHKLLPFITRLLDLFAKSEYVSVYTYLRKGFEVCLRRIFERAENRHRLTIIATMLNWFGLVKMREDDVLEFSSLLDRAAELYKVDTYSDSFSDGMINHVLKNLLSSKNESYSLIGSRLMQRFLDRQGNSVYLESPTIFYEFTQIKLVVGQYDSGDKSFIRHHRETIHVCILRALRLHCQNSVNVKALFLIICCIVLEVPCGQTAAAAACIVMSVQDVALNGENISPTSRYWMHAIVISVMSLICWVHKSPVLYSYVNQIISRRAKEAPQLNPPLMHVYNISHHHVTWNKPTLFFEDWELRYGMWKHFADLLLFSVAILLIVVVGEGRGKKVVIHVPFKVKKIKHTHTVYKTVHHHHIDHAPLEEHEHFHHMHTHEEPPHAQHSQPVPGIGIPEFLPDVPDVPLDLPDLPPPDMPLPLPPHARAHPNRHSIPLYRRKIGKNDR